MASRHYAWAILVSERSAARVIPGVNGTNIECCHPTDGQRRYMMSWQAATVCKACLDAAVAATRVSSRHVGTIESMAVHGNGRVAPKPALDAYDHTF